MTTGVLLRAWFLDEGGLKRPRTGIPVVVNKVGFAAGVKCRVFSAGFGGEGRSNGYSQLTNFLSSHSVHQVPDYRPFSRRWVCGDG